MKCGAVLPSQSKKAICALYSATRVTNDERRCSLVQAVACLIRTRFFASAEETYMLTLSWFSAFFPHELWESSVKYYFKTAFCREFLEQLSDSQQLKYKTCFLCSH
jgi:hypothetical protein